MAMDFFESQDTARRNTGRLVFLFILAVLAIMMMVYVVVAGVVGYSMEQGSSPGQTADWSILLDVRLLAAIILGTIVVVGGGSLYKIAELRSGGTSIAEGLGGRFVNPSTTDATERKLLNVVEEMAIASGTPAPPVYLLDEEAGINAFAAGFSPSDAVVGVTRGCARRLSRDELQGVIAHEFSHILNGDMRLNIRLIGVLHGILVIGIIGYFILRTAMYSGHGHRRSGKKGGNPLPFLALGAGLMIVGYVGTFFGNLIKAAVSRQREFLADASAVQYTRNPLGISGALKKIGGFSRGAKIESPKAPEASHMFFGRAITSGLNALFSTHPALAERIKRIEPSWDGAFLEGAAGAEREAPSRPGAAGFAASRPSPSKAKRPPPPPSALSQIGQPTEAHIQYAAQLVQALPKPVVAAAHEPYGARALIYALLIDTDPESRRIQLERLAQHADPGVNDETIRLLPIVARLKANVRLPLIDMIIPALRALSPTQYEVFKRNMIELIKADDRIDLFEWSLQRICLRHLDAQFAKVKKPRARYYGLKRLQSHCEVLLSTLAYVGHRDENQARQVFARAAEELQPLKMNIRPMDQCGLEPLDRALEALAQVAPRLKRQLLHACAACISADREITVNEAELFRAIADTLGCPVPPLLPGQPLT